MKCHYIYDKKYGKVLIPDCPAVIYSGDMSRCTCRDRPPETFEQFEKKEYNEKLREKNKQIKELEQEVFQLYRIIRKLTKSNAVGRIQTKNKAQKQSSPTMEGESNIRIPDDAIGKRKLHFRNVHRRFEAKVEDQKEER